MRALVLLLRQRIRRDRIQLAIWIVSTGLLALFSASAITTTYGDDAAREGILRLAVANPAILMLRGLPQGGDVAAFTFFQIFTFLALLAGLMSTFLAVRHSRAEEESGRAELVAATGAGRLLPTVATVIHGVGANLLIGAAVTVAFIGGGLDATGSLVTGVATTAVGVTFLAVGLAAAHVMQSSRGANGISVAAVGLAFVLRGFGDAAGTPSADGLSMTSAWPSWLSPIGWAQHVGAFTANDLTPLLLNLGLAVALLVAVFALQSRRDLGASLLVGRPGRADARASLSGSRALAWRLQWPTIIGWSAGAAVFGLFAGALADLVAQVTSTSSTFEDTLNRLVPTTNGSLDQVLISAMFALVGIFAAGSGIQTMVRLRQEEAGGTAELVLATPLSRVRWLVDYLVVGAASILLVVLTASVVSAVAALATGGDLSRAADSFAAGAVQIPAALVFLTVVAFVFAVVPSATVGVGWSLYGGLTFVGEFGALIGLPDWVRNLSPFTHTPVPFGDSVDWSGGVWLLAIATAACALAVVVMRGRELHAG